MSFTFTSSCDSCDAKPVYRGLGLCAVCTHGEASAMWDWLDEKLSRKEKKLAEEYVFNEIFAPFGDDLFDENDNMNPLIAMLLHINQSVLDRLEKIL